MRKRDNPSSLNYFISYTDLLVGLLFLFIILLMTFSLSVRGAERETKEITAKLKVTQARIQRRLTDLEQRVEIRNRLLDRIKQELRPHIPDMEVDYDQGVLRFGASVLFGDGEAELSENAKRALTRLAQVLAHELPCYGAQHHRGCEAGSGSILEAVYIEGHTDERNINTPRFRSNWHLSSERAYETYRHLIDTEPALKSVRNSSRVPLLSASAYAEQRPVERLSEHTRNRRIDIRFLLAPPTGEQISEARAAQ